MGVPSREERAERGVAHPPSPATDWCGDDPMEALEGPLGYLNLLLAATPDVEDLDGHLTSLAAAAGDRQLLLLLLPLLLLELAGLE